MHFCCHGTMADKAPRDILMIFIVYADVAAEVDEVTISGKGDFHFPI